MRFQICYPDHDDTAWHDVEDTDAVEAAERYARSLCSKDSESFGAFEGGGVVLLVRGSGTTVPVMVTGELVPSFRARRLP